MKGKEEKHRISEIMEAEAEDKNFCESLYLACRALEVVLSFWSAGQGKALTSLYVKGLNQLRMKLMSKQNVFKICPKMRRYR